MAKKIFSLEIIFSIAIAIIGVRLGYVQIIKKTRILIKGEIDWILKHYKNKNQKYMWNQRLTLLW